MDKEVIHDFSLELWNFIFLYNKFMYKFHNKSDGSLLAKNKKKAMMIIHHHNNEMCISRLGECLDLQKSSLTSLIDYLEKEGYVKRKPHPDDRRKTLVTLTRKTSDIIKKRQTEMEDYISESFKNLNNNEINDFHSSLKTISGILNKI